MTKIGVFGGTFDPVHWGHIYLARQAVSECDLDMVIVTPAAAQPFKQEQATASGVHRFNMINLAFEVDEKIYVSDIELKKGGVSYTIDTLSEIKRLHGKDTEIFFILGVDAFLKVEQWKDAEKLLRDYSFVVGTRPGYRQNELEGFIGHLNIVYSNKIMTIKNKQIDISSTEIKRAINLCESLSGFVPPDVERYINSNEVYRGIY